MPVNTGESEEVGKDADMAVTDEELMIAFSRGSRAAFDELFSRYRQPIFGFFRRRLEESSAAEELTQETFLALFRASTRYEPSASFRTYLYAIAFNILRSHRRRTAFRNIFLSFETRETEPPAPDEMESALLLRDAVHRLAAQDREILMLREFEELTYTEIALLLQLPLNTVRSRLFRARSALRTLLAPVAHSRTSNITRYEEGV